MNDSNKETIKERACQTALMATDAEESLMLTVNQELETPVKPMELERHGSGLEAPSLYRRGRQSDDQFQTLFRGSYKW